LGLPTFLVGLPAISVGVTRQLAGLPACWQVGLSLLAFFGCEKLPKNSSNIPFNP
jgi:hypothetical protein